jgi:hypothetical protein
MQRSELAQAIKYTNPDPWGRAGLLIALKVMGLLAGYAIFVWITMVQLERRYPPSAERSAGIGSQDQPEPIPGAVVIQGLSPLKVRRSGAPRPATRPQTSGSPGREPSRLSGLAALSKLRNASQRALRAWRARHRPFARLNIPLRPLS